MPCIQEEMRGFLFFTQPMAQFSSVQFSSVAQSCPILCDPMKRSTPDLPVPHHLPAHLAKKKIVIITILLTVMGLRLR